MSDYISREAAIAKLTALEIEKLSLTTADARRVLADMTATDVTEVVHGRWVDNGIPGSILSGCSVCGFTCGSSSFFYCPNCGARMDGGVDDATD